MAVANLYFSDPRHVRYLLDLLAGTREKDEKKSKLERELERALARLRDRGDSRSEMTPNELWLLDELLSEKPSSQTKLAVRQIVADGIERAEAALAFERERDARVQRRHRERGLA